MLSEQAREAVAFDCYNNLRLRLCQSVSMNDVIFVSPRSH